MKVNSEEKWKWTSW